MSWKKKTVSESIDYSSQDDSFGGLQKMMFDHIRSDSDDDSQASPVKYREFSRERGLIDLNLVTKAQGWDWFESVDCECHGKSRT